MTSSESAEPNRFFAQFAAFVVLAVGLLVLAGWTFDMEALTNLAPVWPRISRLTALAFVVSGAALWLTTLSVRRSAAILSLAVTAIGLLVLFRYALSWDVYIDQFTLGPVPEPTPGVSLPRMAPSTAVAFCCFGMSILCALRPRTASAHQTLAIIVLVIGWMGLSRYIFGGEALVPFVNVAAHGSILFLLLSAGALTLRTDAGVAKLLASEGVGGSMARRLLPAAILVPLLAGALTLSFERAGGLGHEAAVSVFALSAVVAFTTFVLINAARGERADRMRRNAEKALRLSEERHQLIVETALDGVIAINVHGLVTGWNSQAEKMFGWNRTEVMGRELAEILIPERLRDQHRAGMRRYAESGIARVLNKRVEMSALHRDGHEFSVELAITPIGFGEELVFSAFIRDITGRLRAEGALRESEQRFRTTANAAPVLIWMSGPDKRCTWFNQRWLDFVGRDMEQEIGDGWCDNVHPADFDRTLDTYHAAFDARRAYEMEFRLQRDDGAWRWLLERATPHLGPNGEFVGYIGTCVDITEHRETVEQLRENRARFKTLAESLPQMIWTCLRDGHTDYLSRQWLDYTGRSESQQLGHGWLEQVHPDDRVKVQMEWARVVASGDTYDVSFRIRRFDGVYRWFKTRAVPLRDPAGRILKWFGSNTDIEDFVLAERKLKIQLERMQLLDRTTHAIGIHQDLRKVFDVVLRSLEENLGIDFACACLYHSEPEQLTVSCVSDRSATLGKEIGIVDQARIEIQENGLSRCLSGELVYEPNIEAAVHPFPARLAAAGLRAMVAAPLMIENEVLGVMVVAKRRAESFSSDDCEFMRQLSSHVALAADQARLYEALQGAYQDLRETQQTVMQQERLRALGQIASGIAHDINNALSPAALYAQSMLTHDAGLSERSREHLGVIQRAIDDVARTVQRMRAFYLPRGLELTLAPVDLNQILVQVIDLTRARWSNIPQERGVVVHVESALTPDLPKILGAENEVRDALTNLVLNAVDALPDGGTITLRTRVDSRDNEVIVEVQDTGVGMSETTRSRCLEPFFTTKGERGTGLGLPMVFGMAQRHSGELEIDSELGRGTTIRLIFPRAPTGMTMREHELMSPPRSLRLLLIDDDPLLLRSLRDALELDAHEVITAEGGQAGIDAFAAATKAGASFDAVITDLGMPYVDGRKVATRIRQLAGQVPIIMLTGWGHRLIASDDKPEHVDKVLSKPPKMAELRQTLAELVQPREE
ncbi:MAG TPA: PAS domain S-box protein [Steroidobacteraceae bacterium]|jgi:PAS domain S-box-containing protein|nr:PAS domain S-box protein [Steroidobacteraceae bacterium]